MKYSEALDYLEQLNTRGIKPGLESVKSLAALVGNPQERLRFVHVAGTNGKGSVSTYIASILNKAGYRVGSYETPAVFEETEIIKVNGKNVSKSLWAEKITLMADILKEHPDEAPTRFEFETVLALLIFEAKACDIVVLECGMGGLLDATNFVKNTDLCVFTPIGMDHMSFLGDTIEEIAANKAGIIKPGSLSVSAVQLKAVADVLSSATYVNHEAISKVKKSLRGSSFDYKELKGIKINPLGINQIENASLACEAVFKLRECGYKIADKAVYKGFEEVYMPGRFEVINKKPTIILDGAHNVPAAERLRENIKEYVTSGKIIYILSMLKDKEYDKVIHMMCNDIDHIITATSPNRARALESLEIAKCVMEVNPMVTAADSIDEAVELALLMADEETTIVVWGSLSHLKEVRACVDNRKNIKSDRHGIEDY
ncbi:MAG: bifunctional folylpolyglutamate synthase/dihydrofolate synthase [Lachnospiraceae bacterium]|nr:bifunctional folylpolyglutamate synthase/dihydrofolate synthase [Lachnospiraceae bacterium]